jgi:hypothetical protein
MWCLSTLETGEAGADAETMDMDTFTLGWGRSWVVRLLGRNQLVRSSDRVESFAVALAVIVVAVAVPFAAAFGTSVKEVRSLTYARQEVSRHQTTASAIADARLHEQLNRESFDVKARWSAVDGVHVGTVSVPDMVRAGDRFDIWIDANGNAAEPPTPRSRAAAEAVGWAALSWIAVAAVVAAGVHALRRRLNIARYADWDRYLNSLAGNDGGRANHEH